MIVKVRKRHVHISNNKIQSAKRKDNICAPSQKQQFSENSNSFTSELTKFVLHPIFWGFFVMFGILALVCFILTIVDLCAAFGATNTNRFFSLIKAFIKFIIMLFLITCSVGSIFCAKEVEKETDKNYVAAIFSNIIALLALIIASVSLVGGL